MILALAGGVGGAKLAHGLSLCLPPRSMVVAVNTGDDFNHLGLQISPDLDTVMYTLAGLADRDRGWGLADESWNFMDALSRLGGETWFKLGDRDLATHIERTRRLECGELLSAITSDFTARLGISQIIAPMTNGVVRTRVQTDIGDLDFQEYFVRHACRPQVRSIQYCGALDALPSPPVAKAMTSPDLRGVVICPSNPFLSIAPILEMPAIKEFLQNASVPVIAMSPLIGGAAVKGPTAKIMTELGIVPSCSSIAAFYEGLIDGFIVDRADAPQVSVGHRVKLFTSNILMRDETDRFRLARETLAYLDTLSEQ